MTNRNVCPGWTDALQRMKKGGVLKLYIPPPLSEDDAKTWGIEPGSARIFEIELLEIRDTSPEDLANSTLPPAPEPEPPPPSGYAESQVIQTWGWDVARQVHANKYQLTGAEISAVSKGLAAGIRGQPPRPDLPAVYPQVKQFVDGRREQVHREEKQKRQSEMEALFATLKNNTNVIQLPDGLRYEILKPGSPARPKTGQIVVVDYTGRLVNGTVFDQTYNEPLHIEVGSVIDGWNEGITNIGKGGRIKLYVPPSLGYGSEDHSSVVSAVPADSTLIYEIELLDIQDPPMGEATSVPPQ